MIEFSGAQDFARVGQELKKAGRQDLRRELFKALNSSTKDSRAEIIERLPDYMPDNYAATLAKDLSTRTTAKGGKNPAVTVRSKGKKKRRLVGALERGVLRHPLYGNRGHWFNTRIQSGFHSETLQRDAPEIRRRLVAAIEDVLGKID